MCPIFVVSIEGKGFFLSFSIQFNNNCRKCKHHWKSIQKGNSIFSSSKKYDITLRSTFFWQCKIDKVPIRRRRKIAFGCRLSRRHFFALLSLLFDRYYISQIFRFKSLFKDTFLLFDFTTLEKEEERT